MDARESPSSVASARDEDDGHLSVAAGLAKDAASLFQSRRYSECVDVLNQLLQKKEDDPKVIHNIAVAEYFRDGCSDPGKLLEVLNKVKKRSEDLACASGEQVDVAGNLGSSVMPGSKGSGTTPHQFSAANASTAYADEFDTSVATLNTAIILFHLHEYTSALLVLEPLYQNIEPIDETTAFHICLLLLDVALASHDASKAADVIQYLEKNFGGDYMIGQGDNGSTAQHQSSNQAVKVNSAPSTAPFLDTSYTDSTSSNSNTSENALARTLSDDALDYETLLLDIGGQNLPRPPPLPSQNDHSRASLERPAPAVDLKLKLHLYKVRLLLLTRNLKATKREVKLAMNIARGRDSSTALLLKSQLEYARGNHRKAIKLLMTSSNRTESGMPSMFNNNLGCIYHQLRKHHTSTLFLKRALESSCFLRSEKPLKLLTFSQDKSLLILYNCGLQYLACGNPMVAARCFHKSGSVFYNQPLLWLRLAECCLLALEKGLLKTHRGSSVNGEVKVHVIGSGKWRQVVVDNETSRNGLLDSAEVGGSSNGGDQPRLSILYARQCLLNALHLLNGLELEPSKDGYDISALEEDGSIHAAAAGPRNSNQKNMSAGNVKAASNVTAASTQANANGDPKETKGSLSSSNALQSSVSAYEEMCRKENHMIKQAVLADLTYVELCMENPLKALSTAKALLELSECYKIYVFLGHIYAAEALCLLNRPKEAADQLSLYVLDGIDIELPYSDEDMEKWRIEKSGDVEELNGYVAAKNSSKEESQGINFLKPEEARGTLYANLASTYATLGDLERAHQLVARALSTIPNHPTVVLAAVYVDLLLGKTEDALVKLKRCSHVRFFPSGLTTVNSS